MFSNVPISKWRDLLKSRIFLSFSSISIIPERQSSRIIFDIVFSWNFQGCFWSSSKPWGESLSHFHLTFFFRSGLLEVLHLVNCWLRLIGPYTFNHLITILSLGTSASVLFWLFLLVIDSFTWSFQEEGNIKLVIAFFRLQNLFRALQDEDF